MKTYKVTFEETIVHRSTIIVNANDEDDAIEVAEAHKQADWTKTEIEVGCPEHIVEEVMRTKDRIEYLTGGQISFPSDVPDYIASFWLEEVGQTSEFRSEDADIMDWSNTELELCFDFTCWILDKGNIKDLSDIQSGELTHMKKVWVKE